MTSTNETTAMNITMVIPTRAGTAGITTVTIMTATAVIITAITSIIIPARSMRAVARPDETRRGLPLSASPGAAAIPSSSKAPPRTERQQPAYSAREQIASRPTAPEGCSRARTRSLPFRDGR
jgi:hypothetical protein